MWKNRAKAKWNSKFRRNVREKYAKLAREKKKWWKINVRGCGKLWFINCEIHRVWESGDINTGFQQGVENGVDNLHLPKITALKRQWETFGKGCKAFFLCYFNPHPPVTFQSTSPRWWGRKKGLRPFRLIISTAVEGCSYAEGAQRCSNAAPLWVPARGGVQLIWYTSSSPVWTNQSRGRVRRGKFGLNRYFFIAHSREYLIKVKWSRLTADCREFVRWNLDNVRFRFASVEEPTNV